jgi:hypothetical protein
LRARSWSLALAAVRTLAFTTSAALARCRARYVRVTAVVAIAAMAVGGEELGEQKEGSSRTYKEQVKFEIVDKSAGCA